MNNWYSNINKSKYTPPSWVFGVVWPILYLTMIISFMIIYSDKNCVNFCYPIILFLIHTFFEFNLDNNFFKYKNFKLALIDLLLLDISLIYIIYLFYPINKLASIILVPYLLWILFASYLSFYIFYNNI